MTARLERALANRRAVAIVIAVTMAVASTSIAVGFLTDDHGFRAALHSTSARAPAASDLFRFVPGDPAGTQLRIRGGLLPWWAAPDLRIHFYRPLTSLAFAADDRVFGDDPLGYHVVSLAWYLALLVAAAAVFRSLLPPAAATLALAVFGLSAAHVEAYAWISARHVVIAGALAAACLAARNAGRRWLALAILAVALASSEAALAAVPLWIALELAATARPWRARVLACLPAVGLAAAYLVGYAALGGGTRGSGGYHDPLSDPLGFAALAVVRVPLLLGDAALGIPAELAHAVAEWRLALAGVAAVGLVALAWRWTVGVATADRPPQVGLAQRSAARSSPAPAALPAVGAAVASPVGAAVASPAAAAVASPAWAAAAGSPAGPADGVVTASPAWAGPVPVAGAAVASPAVSAEGAAATPLAGPASATVAPSARRTVGWLAAGGVAASVLGAAGYPAGRVLVIPDLAFAALIGLVLFRGLTARWPGRVVAGILAIVHLGAAPLATLHTIDKLVHRAQATEAIADEVARRAPPSGRVVIIAASDPMVFLYPRSILADLAPRAVRCWSVISAARAGHRVTRTGKRTLELAPIGRTLLDGSFDWLFRAPDRPFEVGASVEQCGATVRVLAVRDGRPSRIELELRRSFDDPELGLLVWRDHHLVAFTPPALGETIEVPWSPGPSGVL